MDETILIVSRDVGERRDLSRVVAELGLQAWATSGREAALDVVRGGSIALALVVAEPRLEQDAAWLDRLWGVSPDVPVVFLGTDEPTSVALERLGIGALDFIPRYSSPRVMRQQLGEALVRRERWVVERRSRAALEAIVASRERELHGTYRQVLEALGAALDTRDPETQDHTRRVVDQSVQIARAMGVTGEGLVELERGAALHDVGKIGIPDAVLLKPGSLTPEEWVTMKSHCEIGYHMLAGISFLRSALPIVLHHHERYDGRGYPAGLAGEEIPFGARIFAVADAYDAMTSDRPYRAAMPPSAALAELRRCSGSQFDPTVVHAFVQTAAPHSALIASAA